MTGLHPLWREVRVDVQGSAGDLLQTCDYGMLQGELSQVRVVGLSMHLLQIRKHR